MVYFIFYIFYDSYLLTLYTFTLYFSYLWYFILLLYTFHTFDTLYIFYCFYFDTLYFYTYISYAIIRHIFMLYPFIHFVRCISIPLYFILLAAVAGLLVSGYQYGLDCDWAIQRSKELGFHFDEEEDQTIVELFREILC